MLRFFAHVFCIQEMVKQCKRRGCVGIYTNITTRPIIFEGGSGPVLQPTIPLCRITYIM